MFIILFTNSNAAKILKRRNGASYCTHDFVGKNNLTRISDPSDIRHPETTPCFQPDIEKTGLFGPIPSQKSALNFLHFHLPDINYSVLNHRETM